MKWISALAALLLLACGSSDGSGAAPASAPASSPSSGADEPAVEASAGEGAAEAPAMDPEVLAALEARLRRVAPTYIEDEMGEAPSETRVERLGILPTPRGTYVFFKVTSQGDFNGQYGDIFNLAVAVPHGSRHRLLAIPLGEAMSEPGAGSNLTVEAFEAPRLDHDVVRADLRLTTEYYEADTCDSCQARRQAASVRYHLSLLCPGEDEMGELDCVMVEVGQETASPAFELREDGSRIPYPDGDASPPYRIGLEMIDASHVRMSLASGSLDEERRSELGEREIFELGEAGRPRSGSRRMDPSEDDEELEEE